MKIRLVLLFLLLHGLYAGQAQESNRFQKEVAAITAADSSYKNREVIIFTGSSTIRMWKTLHEDFREYPVINHGFGGSQMTDLLFFDDELILQYKPKKIFIYEGDNDIASSKTTARILSSADSLVKSIRQKFPKTPLYFISAKPSISRWNLKEKYVEYNSALKAFAANRKNVFYVDLWTPMIDKNGVVFQDIFIEDGLHMNPKGYAIWKKTIAPYLK
ncbi:SGNH/GDSL hydrolase family protein [Pollutibacter soli]|uniref:SGNH/GDSL hydrolase family protein n=1 Tax=Pollutibacter soli TaxID=3034157 RepID=UPI0030134D85